jgi:hypothetical protein
MIEQAYDLNNLVFASDGKAVSANGAGETIAIVDAFGDPNIASDLETFDANFGISNDNSSGQFALTVATPEGGVETNAGWAGEESLDVEWAHAIAPGASILLVEAPSDTVASLTSAVVWARSQSGVVAISMSWGDSPEFSGETAYDTDFTTPSGHEGVTFLAASGDDGEPNYPSTSPNVLAVGGTTLNVNDAGDWLSESAWVDSGGGTSPYEGTSKPDVAYDADPNTGVLTYDSIPYEGQSGWQVVGGTSAGTPQWSAIIAIADQGRALESLGSLNGPTQTIPDLYALPSSDFNVVSGDGLTGLGSPIGEKIISALVGGGITSVGLALSNPSSATSIDVGQSYTIDWTGGNSTDTVQIWVEGGPNNSWTELTAGVPDSNGSYTWNTTGVDHGWYYFQAWDISTTGATYAVQSPNWLHVVDPSASAPNVSLTNPPLSTSSIAQGGSFTLNFTATDGSGDTNPIFVQLWVYSGNTGQWTELPNASYLPGAQGSYVWNTAGVAPGWYSFAADATNGDQWSSASSPGWLNVTVPTPTFTFTTPTSGQTAAAGGAFALDWSIAGLSSTDLSNATVQIWAQYLDNGSPVWTEIAASVTASNGTYTWTVPTSPGNGTYYAFRVWLNYGNQWWAQSSPNWLQVT